MKKSRIIQIIAIVIITIGIIHLVDHFTGQDDGSFPFAGIGNIIMGFGLVMISKNISEKNDQS